MESRKPAAASRQLVLDLGGAPGLDLDDFLVSPSNAAAFDFVDRWPDWHAPALTLIGPAGSGKTHLAMVWASRVGARVASAADLLNPTDLAAHAAVVLDGGETFAGSEAGLFHLINLLRERGGWLLVTARRHPDLWGLRTADLLSRLRSSPVAVLEAPTADLIRAVLVKLFNDRQIRIDEDVVAYAALHLDQSLDAVRRFVQAIDEASLAASRKITRPLAAATIATLRDEEA